MKTNKMEENNEKLVDALLGALVESRATEKDLVKQILDTEEELDTATVEAHNLNLALKYVISKFIFDGPAKEKFLNLLIVKSDRFTEESIDSLYRQVFSAKMDKPSEK